MEVLTEGREVRVVSGSQWKWKRISADAWEVARKTHAHRGPHPDPLFAVPWRTTSSSEDRNSSRHLRRLPALHARPHQHVRAVLSQGVMAYPLELTDSSTDFTTSQPPAFSAVPVCSKDLPLASDNGPRPSIGVVFRGREGVRLHNVSLLLASLSVRTTSPTKWKSWR